MALCNCKKQTSLCDSNPKIKINNKGQMDKGQGIWTWRRRRNIFNFGASKGGGGSALRVCGFLNEPWQSRYPTRKPGFRDIKVRCSGLRRPAGLLTAALRLPARTACSTEPLLPGASHALPGPSQPLVVSSHGARASCHVIRRLLFVG